MRRYLGLSLIMSSITFILLIIISSIYKTNYSIFFHSIGDLVLFKTKKLWEIEGLYYIANTFLLFGGVLAVIDYKEYIPNKTRIVFILISIIGTLGIILRNFPPLPYYLMLTSPVNNIYIAFHTSLLLMVFIISVIVIGISWILFRTSNIIKYRLYAIFSLMIMASIIINGSITIILFLLNINEMMSVFQRLATGSFILWLFVKGYLIYYDSEKNI